MHAHELVEVAALVAMHAEAIVRSPDPIPEPSVEQYWVASKSRMDRWGRRLKRLSAGSGRKEPRRPPASPLVRSVLEEILSGEVLTRVWAAVLSAYDAHRRCDSMEPVGRSVLLGHLEARHRVLTLLVRSPRIDAELAVKLNRLRRRTERWCDVLLGYLAALGDTCQFAVDPDRAREFGEDFRLQQPQPGGRQAWPLMLASFKAAFANGWGPISPNADLNAGIADSVLSCFPPGAFDSVGVPRSAWLLRLSSVACDTQGMIDELVAMDDSRKEARQGKSPALRLRNRLRWHGP